MKTGTLWLLLFLYCFLLLIFVMDMLEAFHNATAACFYEPQKEKCIHNKCQQTRSKHWWPFALNLSFFIVLLVHEVREVCCVEQWHAGIAPWPQLAGHCR